MSHGWTTASFSPHLAVFFLHGGPNKTPPSDISPFSGYGVSVMEQTSCLGSTMAQVVRCLLLTGGCVSEKASEKGTWPHLLFGDQQRLVPKEGFPNVLNTWLWGRFPGQEKRSSGDKLSETSKRTDWGEALGGFLKLDVARNRCWGGYGKKELCLEFQDCLARLPDLCSLHSYHLCPPYFPHQLCSALSSYLKLSLKALSL